jgi:hypothetical protein
LSWRIFVTDIAMIPDGAPRARTARLMCAAAVAGAAVLVWWEGRQHFGTGASQASVGAVIGAALGSAVLLGRGRQQHRSGAWLIEARPFDRGDRLRCPAQAGEVAVWIILLFAVIGWDLFSFVRQSHDWPTLSYLVGRVTRFDWGRAAFFAAWLGCGAYLAVGGRRSEPS